MEPTALIYSDVIVIIDARFVSRAGLSSSFTHCTLRICKGETMAYHFQDYFWVSAEALSKCHKLN